MRDTNWQGCRVSNRLNISFDDKMHQKWTLYGKDDTGAASGETHEMIRLAQAILENLPDNRNNGPVLDRELIYQELPERQAGDLEEVMSLAQDREHLDGMQRRFVAGALLAIGAQMLRNDAMGAWTSGREPLFPFRMEVLEMQDRMAAPDAHASTEQPDPVQGQGGHMQDRATGRCVRCGNHLIGKPPGSQAAPWCPGHPEEPGPPTQQEQRPLDQKDAERHRHPVRQVLREGAKDLFWCPPDMGEPVPVTTPLQHPDGGRMEVTVEPMQNGWCVRTQADLIHLMKTDPPIMARDFCERNFLKMGIEMIGDQIQAVVDSEDQLPEAVMKVAQAALQLTTLDRFHSWRRMPRDTGDA